MNTLLWLRCVKHVPRSLFRWAVVKGEGCLTEAPPLHCPLQRRAHAPTDVFLPHPVIRLPTSPRHTSCKVIGWRVYTLLWLRCVRHVLRSLFRWAVVKGEGCLTEAPPLHCPLQSRAHAPGDVFLPHPVVRLPTSPRRTSSYLTPSYIFLPHPVVRLPTSPRHMSSYLTPSYVFLPHPVVCLPTSPRRSDRSV